MDISVLLPEQPTDPDSVIPWARLVVDTGISRLWMGQSFQIESHMALSRLGAAGLPIGVGIATALAPLRSPYDAALQARSLALMTGGDVTVAYGSADPDFVTGVRGAPLARPASYVQEYVRLVRGLIDGKAMSSDSPGLEMRSAVLPPSLPTGRIEVGIGVLREGMARKAGAVADVAVCWLTPKWYVRDVVRPALASAGRDVRVVVNVHVGLSAPGRNVLLLAQSACQFHVRRRHYAEMLRASGLGTRESDPISSTRELVERRVFVSGDADEVAAEILSFSEYGIDEVVLNLTGVSMVHGREAAMDDSAAIISAITSATSSDSTVKGSVPHAVHAG